MLAAFVNRLRLLTEVSPLVLLAGINFALLAPLTKSLQRKAVVVMILHGYEVFEPLPFSRKFLLRWCDGFWAVSYSTRKLFCEKQGVPPDRVKVIYHGIEPHWIIEGETALKLRVDRKKDGDFTLKFLCVTRMRPHDIGKKVDVLLQAFSKVRIDHPHVHLTIVGDGERRYVYENLAKDLSLHQSVTFTGDISDQALYELYRNSDVFVLPSVKEGFGLVFLEAMAFGLPCIGAKATSVPEIIENERSGLLADPDHVDNLALQMARLADSADMRTKLGEAGRRRVVECFGFDRFAKNINSFLTDFPSCKTLDKPVF
jgi:glycosyltransferase involved in cell wall biosynthesis